MRTLRIASVFAVVIAAAASLPAADSRVYQASIEQVWDEAVKATRDADLDLTNSKRSEHWFTMQTPKKALARTVEFEVSLSHAGDQTTVSVRAVDEDGSKKSTKVIAAYLAALDKRMD